MLQAGLVHDLGNLLKNFVTCESVNSSPTPVPSSDGFSRKSSLMMRESNACWCLLCSRFSSSNSCKVNFFRQTFTYIMISKQHKLVSRNLDEPAMLMLVISQQNHLFCLITIHSSKFPDFIFELKFTQV